MPGARYPPNGVEMIAASRPGCLAGSTLTTNTVSLVPFTARRCETRQALRATSDAGGFSLTPFATVLAPDVLFSFVSAGLTQVSSQSAKRLTVSAGAGAS